MENNQQNWEEINERFSHLEKKIEEIIEQKHQKLGVEVTGGLNNEKIKIIYITPERLIKIYNEVPQIFLEYAHPVSLTPDTYREKTGGEIYLESAPNGKYWLIATEAGKKLKYWLVPNGNIKLKLHRLLSIKKLFNFEGEEPNSTSELVLEKPAEVSILPSGKKWKLQETGKINVGCLSEKIKEENNQASQIKELLGIANESLQKNQEMKKQIERNLQAQKENHSQIQQDVNSLKTQLETIENQVTEQKNAAAKEENNQASQIKELLGIMKESLQKNQEMKKQIESSLQAQKENHSQIQYILWEVNSLKTKLETIENQLAEQKKAAVSDQSHLNFRKEEEKNMVKLYNENYDSLLRIAKPIDLTRESWINILVEMPEKILFKEDSKGKFLVIFWEDSKQYLLPVPKLSINLNDIKNIILLSSLFEFINYQERKSKNFKLVEPAEVAQRESEWELKTKGKIKFD